jgi:hypothetical protein
MSLEEVSSTVHSGDPGTKPLSYYKRYDSFLDHHNVEPLNILEIGTFQGESTRVLAAAFPLAKIVTVDIEDRLLDFSDLPMVTSLVGDQTDRAFLEEMLHREFPNGLDLVIDDASHLGIASMKSFNYVVPFLKSGGAYIVEDWGTGYWPSFPDGERFTPTLSLAESKSRKPWRTGSQIMSHSYGMVGFVKSLVDLTALDDIQREMNTEPGLIRLRCVEFSIGVCMVIKD